MSGEKPREIALEILFQRKTGHFVENLLDSALHRSRLSGPNRGLCQELVYGVVRWQSTLDWLIDQKTNHRPQKPVLQDLLRLGLYQIFWLDRIPNHAAVNETVASAKRRGLTSQAGFINAVLRGYLREFDSTKKALTDLKTTHPALGFAHPDWLVDRWQKRWGHDKTVTLLEWNNIPPKTFARINTLKADPAKLLTQWREEGVEYDFVQRRRPEADAPLPHVSGHVPHDWLPENLVFELRSHPPLRQLPSFQQGLFYIQDPSTLLAVQALDPKPGESILDLCAAPGGKLTCIAQQVHNEARIIGHDISPDRLRLIEENCARLGVTCVQLASPERGVHAAASTLQSTAGIESVEDQSGVNPALQPDSPFAIRRSSLSSPLSSLPSPFDRILLDAPCSNTGVLRRRVDLRWRITADEIARLRQVQLNLLTQASNLLKPGGTLVYSTCSLEPEENEQVTAEFIRTNSSFKLEFERCLLPFIDATDGAYVARLLRR